HLPSHLPHQRRTAPLLNAQRSQLRIHAAALSTPSLARLASDRRRTVQRRHPQQQPSQQPHRQRPLSGRTQFAGGLLDYFFLASWAKSAAAVACANTPATT